MDWFPHINWAHPEAERDYARHISTQLLMLQQYEDDFRTALSLLDHVEARWNDALAIEDPFQRLNERASRSKWLRIPIESAAFTIYHFQSTLRSVRDQLKHAPTLAAKVDSKGLEQAYQRFQAEFPQWRVIRDFFGHYADKMFSPERIEEMRGDAGPVVHGSLAGGRTITFTNYGEYVHFAATYEAAERLRAVKQDAYLAFRKVSVWPPPDQSDRR